MIEESKCQQGTIRATPPTEEAIHKWQSGQLLGQANEARIVHGDCEYRLLRTRNGKLILIK